MLTSHSATQKWPNCLILARPYRFVSREESLTACIKDNFFQRLEIRHQRSSTRIVDGEISLGVLCSPDVVTDLDEKTAEEKEAEANGAEQVTANDFLRQDGELPEAYVRRVFKRVFCQDIEKVLSMEVCLVLFRKWQM